MKKSVVLFNMSNYWNWEAGVQNRNFHIFQALLKDDDVENILLVDILPYTWRKAVKHYVNLSKIKRNKDVIWSNKFSVAYRVNKKVLVFSSVASYLYKKQWQNDFLDFWKTLNWSNVWEWNYNVFSYEYWQGLIKADKKIFDAVDNWLLHSSYKKYQQKLEKNYQDLLLNSDLVFTVSKNLKKYFEKNFKTKDNIVYIPNASPQNLLKKREINKDLLLYKKIQNIKKSYKYILGFIGVIQENRIDFALLDYLAKKNPDKALILCGPVWKGLHKKIKLLQKNKNVFWLGSVKRKDWYTVASQFDIALSPHLTADFMQYISPTKIYEYLAVGLAVVSTKISGVDELSKFIYVADNKEVFQKFIEKILSDKNSGKEKAWSAEDNLWLNRYEEIKKFCN